MKRRKRLFPHRLWTAVWLSLANLSMLTTTLAAPLPLPSSAVPAPYIQDFLTSNYRYGTVNLFTRSLQGYSETIGPVTLEYSERYSALKSSFNNFVLTGVTFQNRASLPVLSVSLSGSDFIINFGTTGYRATLAGSSGTKLVYLLAHGGRFSLSTDSTRPNEAELQDTAMNVVFRLVKTSVGTDIAYLPDLATLSDNSRVHFGWYTNAAHRLYLPREFSLERNGATVETLTLNLDTANLPACPATTLTSSLDPSRSLAFTYAASSPAGRGSLKSISIGSSGLLGFSFEYQPDTSGHDLLERVKDLKGNQITEYRLETVGGYTAYTGIRNGPATTGMTTFTYDTALRTAAITAPAEPNNPKTITLDSVGRATRVADAACPSLPKLVVNYHDTGLLKDATVWNRCDDEHAVQTVYNYDESGTLTGTTSTALVGESPQVAAVTISEFDTASLRNGLKVVQPGKISDPMGDFVTFGYHPDGSMKTISADSGRKITTFSYDLNSDATLSAVHVTHPNQRKDRETFDSAGRLKERVVHEGGDSLKEEFNYDSYGRLQNHKDPLGNSVTYAYKAPGDSRFEYVSKASPDGTETSRSDLTYDADLPGRVSTIVTSHSINGNTASSTTRYSYVDGLPLVTKTSVQAGSKVATLGRVEYDPSTLRPAKVCGFSEDDADHSCQSYAYKNSGVLAGKLESISTLSEGKGGGRPVTKINYDSHGDVTGTTAGETNSGMEITTAIYTDGFGRTSKVVANEGTSRERRQELSHDPAGKLTSEVSKIGGATVSSLSYSYDNGQRSRLLKSTLDSVSNHQTVFSYEPLTGRLTSVKSGFGDSGDVRFSLDVTAYDAFDRPLTQTAWMEGVGPALSTSRSYYPSGLLRESRDERGNVTTFEQYDSFGRPLRVSNALATTTYEYGIDDNQDFLTVTQENKTTDPALRLPSAVRQTFDFLGRTVESYDSITQIKRTSFYDARGDADKVVTAYESGGDVDTITVTYDDMHRVTSSAKNGTVLARAAYSGLGFLIEEYDGHNNPTVYRYDTLGRLTEAASPSGTYSLNTAVYRPAAGILFAKQETTPYGDEVASTFTLDGELKTQEITDAAGVTRSSQLTYSPTSRRLTQIITSMTGTQDTAAVDYGYDAAGRVSSVTNNALNDGQYYNSAFARGFNEYGDLISHSYPGDTGRAEYHRDGFGRITDILWNGSPAAHYTYDGPVLTGIRYGDGALAREVTYDPVLPLVRGVKDTASFNGSSQQLTNLSYGYDEQYRLSSRGDSGARALSEGFGYSPLGDVSSYTASSSYAPLNFTRNFQPEPDGVLGALGGVDPMYRIPGFQYDARLNTIRDKGARTFSWDLRGIQSVQGAGVRADFVNDALGQVLSYEKHFGEGASKGTLFTRDGGMVLMQAGEAASPIVGGEGASLVGRHVFYNESYYDGNDKQIKSGAAAGSNNDDADAIDPTKSPLVSGAGQAGFANWTGYTKGINGLVYDVASPSRTPTAADFHFHNIGKGGTSNPGQEVQPSGFAVWPGGGEEGSDRIVITFANNTLLNTWLQVDIEAGFGLPAPETHYWGNAGGDTGTGNTAPNILVGPQDEIFIRAHPSNALRRSPIGDPADVNKSSISDPSDQIYVRSHNTSALSCVKMITR